MIMRMIVKLIMRVIKADCVMIMVKKVVMMVMPLEQCKRCIYCLYVLSCKTCVSPGKDENGIDSSAGFHQSDEFDRSTAMVLL